jgi:hypothetical protein
MYAILSKRGERDKESLVRKGFHFMDDLLPNKEEKGTDNALNDLQHR